MDDYKIIVEQEHQTVAAHYEVEPKPAEGYQSEAALEKSLIKQLQGQGYEYVQVKNEAGLLVNLRIMKKLSTPPNIPVLFFGHSETICNFFA